MSNSQEQSLNKDMIFLPVSESSPEYLHCERERYALERLLSAGPEAFYTTLSAEHLVPFLSPEEVNQISGRVKDYHSSYEELEGAEEGGSSGVQDFSARYFPTHSDTPAPCLELGWPEGATWVGMGRAVVYTSPPADEQPPVREIIRRLLQGASKVIAMVTDRLTDSTVIGDLRTIASRGVPVYIILNQRSSQENLPHHRLRHPNIQVRVLGGKTFCSREGKIVMGELKDNFLLVDLETVVNGSYSFTWSDAHLHRQLVTVLSGPVVESFDREFRILFAASLPVPDTWKTAKAPIDEPHHHSVLLDLNNRPKYFPMEPINSPTPPPADYTLDWEALGVIHRGSPVNQQGEPMDMNMNMEEPLQHFTAVNKKPPFGEEFCLKDVDHLTTTHVYEGSGALPSQEENQPSTETETQHRIQPKTYGIHLSKQRSSGVDEKESVWPSQNKMETGPREEAVGFPSRERGDRSTRREDVMAEELGTEATESRVNSGADSPSTSRRPLILKVPQRESFSSLSDIMRRLQPHQSSSTQLRRGAKTIVSELSSSMMGLSVMHTDPGFKEKGPSVPQASYFDPFRMTPAFALMRKRNDEFKTGILRPPKTFLPPTTRPRSGSVGLQRDWRRPPSDWDLGKEDRK
ncbi:LOW QUALITY PROTEIN: protein FAM83D [Salvelinus fontinalis]|uniref:LOW QUALITY PROTEIN: protein FAM83D n=1 Tax=Salvelinus fontinalis TaxID=8038 RepID=UPI0024853566|nr:LOW QUALITY PROTEIN: protein FAM83D [Salvelinus fontinalis]